MNEADNANASAAREPEQRATPWPAHWPVVGVCGFQNAGKTTLLEATIPLLVARGLRVAVVKSDAHGIEVDRPGKDSDRLFRAGASVVLCGPDEAMMRVATPREKAPLKPVVRALLRAHDVVLVEGHKGAPLPKVWLHGAQPVAVPPEAREVVAELAWEPLEQRVRLLLAEIDAVLARAATAQPTYLGLLVGGASRRMGEPKHRLRMPDGRELLEHMVERLQPVAAGGGEVVLLGGPAVEVAPSLVGLPRVPDASAGRGPVAGMLSALRHAPEARWLFAACDQPALTAAGADWLLASLRSESGAWGVMAQCDGVASPLPCVLDGRLRDELEALFEDGAGPRRLAGHPCMRTLPLLQPLHHEWDDVDTPAQWSRYLDSLS